MPTQRDRRRLEEAEQFVGRAEEGTQPLTWEGLREQRRQHWLWLCSHFGEPGPFPDGDETYWREELAALEKIHEGTAGMTRTEAAAYIVEKVEARAREQLKGPNESSDEGKKTQGGTTG